jgi:two-component system chemotaxis response regulator CheY
MKILVVDESALMRRILVRAISSLARVEIVEAADGVAALERCDGSVDLVVTDWSMPVMGGLELTKHLRANPTTSNLPVIMVTARNLRSNVAEAAEAGVSAYLLKPISPEGLRRKIQQIMSAEQGPAAGADGARGTPGGPAADGSGDAGDTASDGAQRAA